jgi:hypothetical protein
MNERIKQLAIESKLIAPEYNGFDHTRLSISQQRFAELIVRECGGWWNNRLVVEPDYGIEHRIERNRAVVRVMKEFNQHFGVEE